MNEEQLRELKTLLDNPRTGLKDSSDTNKTRYAIFSLFEEVTRSYKQNLIKEIEEMEKITTTIEMIDTPAKFHNDRGYNKALGDFITLITKNI